MVFEDALKAMREGKKVTRKTWKFNLVPDQTIYIDETHHICLSTSINEYEMIKILAEWILAEDWEIVKDDNAR